ncbi:phosphatase PAP2 family protein [Lentilitoribacter sp. Alg239-R112]|uniref:phosphatase PAP2 family protein n=1 Tax=Lentilitoribacter sp. Alg239-R112 TaxID=2305987 RepID=UPI0013A6C54F|nr:phosphatase PAP2 family protein [Lentilitoribacter sp. Alg239-R112]
MTDHPNYYAITMIFVIAMTIAVSVVFLIYPQLDIYLASFFADGKNGFPLNQSQFLVALRFLYNVEITVLCVTAVSMSLYTRQNRDITKTPHQFWDLIIASFIAGPLVLVNMILKSYWGRPRPAHIAEFGGTSDFVPPYYISDQCQSNCSFVSGEGSAIATSGILLGIIAWTALPHKRKLIITLITMLSALGIGLRFVKGRHFMSDSLLAALFSAIVILLIYKIFKISNIRDKITLENITHDFGLIATSLRLKQNRRK